MEQFRSRLSLVPMAKHDLIVVDPNERPVIQTTTDYTEGLTRGQFTTYRDHRLYWIGTIIKTVLFVIACYFGSQTLLEIVKVIYSEEHQEDPSSKFPLPARFGTSGELAPKSGSRNNRLSKANRAVN